MQETIHLICFGRVQRLVLVRNGFDSYPRGYDGVAVAYFVAVAEHSPLRLCYTERLCVCVVPTWRGAPLA